MNMKKCDKCGKIEKTELYGKPEDWVEIYFRIGSHGSKRYHLCQSCAKALNLSSETPKPTIADRLLEIIEELVEQGVENVMESRS